MKTGTSAIGQAEAEALMQRGVQCHREGRLADAEGLYLEVLRRQPLHSGALHLLGVIAFQSGQAARSVELFDRAIAIRPGFAEAYDSRGTALYALGRFDEAVASYDRAIGLKPDNAAAHANRANVLQALGRSDDALAGYDRAIALGAGFPEVHFGRGATLNALQRYEDALASHERAIALRPDYAKAFQGRGAALHALGRLADSLASHDRAVALNPEFAEAFVDRGVVLDASGRFEDAVASYDRAIALRPDLAEAFNNRGTSLVRLGLFEAALASFDKALDLRSDYAAAHTHRGNALYALGRHDDALASHDHAIGLQADFGEAYSNRANALSDLGRYEGAVADYQKAIAANPDFAKAHLNLAMCLLRLGRFEAGWREYEWRIRSDKTLSARRYSQPAWTGQESGAGRTVFIYHEQGLGDAIQFCRYAAMLAVRGADVVLAAPPSLHGLIATLDPRITVIGERDVPGHFDFHCPLLSLPLAFGTDLDAIPASPRYLSADQARRSGWASRLGPGIRPRIGAVWSGSRLHKNDANRSIPYRLFNSIFCDDADWISLQNELRPADADLVLTSSDIRYFGDELKTFDDTAALIDRMDLVVTVDTSVAHLAGALGKPVWILLPFNADWRWLRDRPDSPWYPTARLFRQGAIGDWTTVLEAVKTSLPSFLEGLSQADRPATPPAGTRSRSPARRR
jgi:tetratricopeptide (TPR) repeat protein